MFTGDGHYRHHEPSRFLGRVPGVFAIDCHLTHRALWPLAELADVLILPVVTSWEFFPLIERRRTQGKITVLETNDFFHKIQPWNPISTYWQDAEVRAEHLRYIRECDAVQTSTETLAAHWQPYAKNVVVFPNHLSSIEPLQKESAGPLTIGWAGSQGHLGDWYATCEFLTPWLEAHPEIHIAVMTHEEGRNFLNLPPDRYFFQQGGLLSEYLEFLKRLDIGLAPLLPTAYNRCRSDVKFLEYASSGVVGLYADLPPYSNSVKHEETGFLCSTPSDFLTSLDKLLEDPALRSRVRNTAYKQVAMNRLLQNHIQQRLDFYRSLLQTSDTSLDLIPPDILQTAERHEQYFRLISGPEEKPLIEHLQAPVGDETKAAQLRAILSKHPKFYLCARTLQKLENDIGKPEAALATGRQALALEPCSSIVLSEYGRSYFLLKDQLQAERNLREAVRIDPQNIAAWGYLLRFLERTKAEDFESLKETLSRLFPDFYRVQLLSLRLSKDEDLQARLVRVFQHFEEILTPAEKLRAHPEFVIFLTYLTQRMSGHSCLFETLSIACRMFPYSARILDAYALLLQRAGKYAEAKEIYLKLLELKRISSCFQTEYGNEINERYRWQVGADPSGEA